MANSTGPGGVIIIGDEIVAKMRANRASVNHEMLGELDSIIEQYEDNASTITADQQAFFFNCVMQIVYVTTP